MTITTIDGAKTALALQTQIDTITELQARAQQAKNQHLIITRLGGVFPSGEDFSLITAPLDDAASQAAVDYCLSVYATMLTQLNAQLSALLA